MSLPENVADQFRLQRRRIVVDIREVFDLQRLDHFVLDIVLPLHEVRHADVLVYDVLALFPAHESRHPAQP